MMPPTSRAARPLLAATLATAVSLMLAAGLSAQSYDLTGTGHDFSSHSDPDAGNDYQSGCSPCHGAFGGVSEPETSGTTYQMYGSGSMDMQTAAQPSGTSLVCLSCHDGTIGLHVEIGYQAVLGDDLRNDHPISVTYDDVEDPAFRPIAEVRQSGLKLFGVGVQNQVECATCHNPHDNTQFKPFLREINSGGDLCTTCHIK